MKNRLVSLLLLLVPMGLLIPQNRLVAQHHTTYEIHPGSTYKVVELEPALDMCDLTKYRKETERVKMLFDDDTIVELFSANELMRNGIEVEMSYINRSAMVMVNMFQLHPDGYLIERADKISKEETIRRLKKLQD